MSIARVLGVGAMLSMAVPPLAVAASGAGAIELSVPGSAGTMLFAAALAALVAVSIHYYRLARRFRRLRGENAELRRKILIDPLTGLENRVHLSRELQRLFDLPGERRIGVCHLELEQFKTISRTVGQTAGEEALRTVAAQLRDVAGEANFIARIRGDEFIVVMPGVESAAAMERMAGEMLDLLNLPIWIGANQRRLGGFAGLAIADDAVPTPERLLTNADLALYEARKAGPGRFRMFTDGARLEYEAREKVIDEIHEGLRDNAFEPYFQPQVEATTGRHIGFEALARWRHPTRGVLSPGEFLPAAEQSGLIDLIGAAVLRKALQAVSRWRLAGFQPPQLGLNFSAAELRDPTFVDKLQWDLELVDIDPGQISIEVLESVLIEDGDDPAARNVAALGAAGFRIDLDDFGTGHAAISNLGRIHVDRLKIDRSFVRGVDRDPEQRKLAEAVLKVAATFGLETIAEGVETDGEARTLIDLGCACQQGYLHGAPLSAEDCMSWMAENAARQRAVALSAGAA